MLKCLALTGIFFYMVLPTAGQQKNDTWKGFERIYHTVDGHKTYIVKPTKPLAGNPWVWRASFPDWHAEMDSMLLVEGFYITYINIDDQYGNPYSMRVWDDAYHYFVDSVGLSYKVALEAVSRGGLYALGWAKRNPDKVNCIYSETPVYDFKSWPGGRGKGLGDTAAWQQLKQVYHFTEAQAVTYDDNPIDHLEGLASFKVPVLNVIGLNDKVAPPSENTYLLSQRYIAFGGPVEIYPVTKGPQELYGHHFPLDRPGYYAGFIYGNAYPVKPVLPYSNYFKTRDGLNHFYDVINKKKKATVAFLGGSITFNPGWRDKVCAYLKERYSDVSFHFIAAGIPSLGSNAHAFRLQHDVVDSGKTDLLFVEAAVNDRGNGMDSISQVRTLEGIVRHAKKSNPQLDIVMMSFADGDKTNDYNKGIVPTEIANHELIAAHYGLPSINLGKEVADKINNKEFNWQDDFKDIHPAPFGQELYFANIKKLLEGCFAQSLADTNKTVSEQLPDPLDKNNIATGKYYDLANAKLDGNWQLDSDWTPKDGLSVRDGFVHVPMLVATKPGATLSLKFKGTAIGIAEIAGSDVGIIGYSIDGAPFKTIDQYTQYSSWLHLPWYLLLDSNLKNTNHVLKIKITEEKNKNSKGNACRIVHFLVNG